MLHMRGDRIASLLQQASWQLRSTGALPLCYSSPCAVRRLHSSHVASALDLDVLQRSLGKGVTMLSADKNNADIIALNKPFGVLSHPNPNNDSSSSSSSSSQSLLNCKYEHHEEYFYTINPGDGVEHRYYLCHRLDSHTSGLIVLAHSKPLANAIKESFKRRWARKHYQARVFGSVHEFDRMLLDHSRASEGKSKGKVKSRNELIEWIDAMTVTRDGGKMRAVDPASPYPDKGRVLTARTAVSLSPLSTDCNVTTTHSSSIVLDLRPSTGFTHQLRYQCFKHGFPIVGDKTYGDKGSFGASRTFSSSGAGGRSAAARLYLHSHSITLPYSYGGVRNKVFSAEAPTPPEFTL